MKDTVWKARPKIVGTYKSVRQCQREALIALASKGPGSRAREPTILGEKRKYIACANAAHLRTPLADRCDDGLNKFRELTATKLQRKRAGLTPTPTERCGFTPLGVLPIAAAGRLTRVYVNVDGCDKAQARTEVLPKCWRNLFKADLVVVPTLASLETLSDPADFHLLLIIVALGLPVIPGASWKGTRPEQCSGITRHQAGVQVFQRRILLESSFTTRHTISTAAFKLCASHPGSKWSIVSTDAAGAAHPLARISDLASAFAFVRGLRRLLPARSLGGAYTRGARSFRAPQVNLMP